MIESIYGDLTCCLEGTVMEPGGWETCISERMCHIEHMVTVSIRELHMNTGRWVRGVSEPIVITERGQPVATLAPFVKSPGRSFRDRKLAPGFAELKSIDSDSGRFLEEDRR